MLTYSKIAGKPATFRSFTGMEVVEFDKLYEFVEREYPACEEERLSRRKRERSIGGGRRFKVDLIDRLLMALVYYRFYMTYALEGYLFDLDQANICRDIKYLEPLIKRCIPLPQKIHARTKKIGTIEELLTCYPEFKAILDTTEQEIPRPQDKAKRKSHYSGKRKRHTVKTQIVVNTEGMIMHKSRHFRGRRHDYDGYKDIHPSVPPDVETIADSGFQGIQKDFPDMKVRLPIKKKPGRKLTAVQKAHNKAVGRDRIGVEHAFSRLKKFRVMGDVFRNRLCRYDTMTGIVCGLVNFRTAIRVGWDVGEFVG